VYIAALRRSGSTVLAESLTRPPHAFMFLEPRLARGQFRIRDDDAAQFQQHGIDLRAFRERHASRASLFARLWHRRPYPSLLDAFRHELVPQLARYVSQIGVKEIFHEGWSRYLEQFPQMRVVVTARDPRDIYLSLCDRTARGHGSWQGPCTPQAVSKHLLEEFRHQQEMTGKAECLLIRYEDLCTKPEIYEKIKAFVESPIPDMGEVGAFTAGNPLRRGESQLHGGRISSKQVARWRIESDPDRAQRAQETFDRMEQYCRFWGYNA
jgi:hypothetical protein